jgi:hypothetical protein
VNRLLKPVVVLLATVYFVVDAVLMVVARPVADWLSERRIFCGLKAWIVSLSPYPTLALFALPVILLEPAKPYAAYLVATGHFITGLTVFAVGEILKLVVIERLFSVSCQKLLSIPAFAWGYGYYCRIMTFLASCAALEQNCSVLNPELCAARDGVSKARQHFISALIILAVCRSRS